MKLQVSWVSLVLPLCLALALPACSDDTTAPKKDAGRRDKGRRDLGPQPDQGELPDGPVADQPRPDQFAFFTDKGPVVDQPKTADKGKLDKPVTSKEAGTAPSNDTCANAETLTWSGATITRTVDTTNAADDVELGSSSCTGDYTSGNDVFFKITLPAGKYNLKLTGANDGALYVLSSCSVSACVEGSDEIGSGVAENIALTVSASATYFIGIDSYDPVEAGSYTLTISSAGSAPDVGPKLDTLKKDSGPPPPDGPTGTVKIVITEIMANPGAVGDDKGEWFEVYNAGTTTVNLKGWKFREAPPATAAHTIATDLLVPAGQYRVLGNNAQTSTNGGVTVAYAYPATTSGPENFSNTADEIYLYDAANTLIDSVAWTSTWSITSGVSLSLKNPSLDNSVFANWCLEKTAWTGSAGDKGTPGAAAGCP